VSLSPVFCAIDTTDLANAQKLAGHVREHVHGFKLGLEFFIANGVNGYMSMARFGLPVFLDLKLHDIPITVAKAIVPLLTLRPAFLTIHASGGPAMMRQTAHAVAKAGAIRPKILGVTVLTSLDANDLAAIGQNGGPSQQVVRLAKLAKDNGLDGVICSPEEVQRVRAAIGDDFILMVPGIRPDWAAANDQKRTLTPRAALEAGATYLVIGRPITEADNPADAARRIRDELA
jgi:orotidine-5'-phosphate decarboxylase